MDTSNQLPPPRIYYGDLRYAFDFRGEGKERHVVMLVYRPNDAFPNGREDIGEARITSPMDTAELLARLDMQLLYGEDSKKAKSRMKTIRRAMGYSYP